MMAHGDSISALIDDMRAFLEDGAHLGLDEWPIDDPSLLDPRLQKKKRAQRPKRPPRERPAFAQSMDAQKAKEQPKRVRSEGPTWSKGSGATLAPKAPPRPLETVHTELLTCVKCNLSQNRHRVCVGTGTAQADVMVIRLMPSVTTDRAGDPYDGKDGVMLRNMLEKVLGVPTASAFITSVVKCRPNPPRAVKLSEVKACRGYLVEQMHNINPQMVVAFGEKVAKALFSLAGQNPPPIGQVHHFEGLPVLYTHDLEDVVQNQGLKRPVLNHLLTAKGWMDQSRRP